MLCVKLNIWRKLEKAERLNFKITKGGFSWYHSRFRFLRYFSTVGFQISWKRFMHGSTLWIKTSVLRMKVNVVLFSFRCLMSGRRVIKGSSFTNGRSINDQDFQNRVVQLNVEITEAVSFRNSISSHQGTFQDKTLKSSIKKLESLFLLLTLNKFVSIFLGLYS